MFKKFVFSVMLGASMFALAGRAQATLAGGLDTAVSGAVQSSDYSGYHSTEVAITPDNTNGSTTYVVLEGPVVVESVQLIGDLSGATTIYMEFYNYFSTRTHVVGDINYYRPTFHSSARRLTHFDILPGTNNSGSPIGAKQAEVPLFRPKRFDAGVTIRVFSSSVSRVRISYKKISAAGE